MDITFGFNGFRSFVFWPITGDPVRQAEVFGKEIIPAVRTVLGDPR